MARVPQGERGDAPRSGSSEAEVVSIDKALVERAQRGDRAALRTLLVQQADALYSRVIRPRAGDAAVAEDILKATMVTAIEKLHTFRWEGRSIYFWLRQIAVNKVIDHHRRTQRGRRLAEHLKQEGELAPIAPSRSPEPESALIAREERQINRDRIKATLAAINPRYRRAIELRLVEELPREECARRLEVTVGTFDVLFFRAVRSFRAAFGDREEP